MPLISCKECAREISDTAAACPGCGAPQQLLPRFAGPPHDCARCGGTIRKTSAATSEGSGCLIALVGLLLAPLLIGIPILIWGLSMASRRVGFWECQRCGNKAPRKIGWFEYTG